ncbi:beta-ketoacyl-[acyl-carrier-protein] synthase family protein [Cytophaga hutchinsonii]|uniref:3-oxoacyl-[acyl-carrier-protein] synthase II n=1 Tax=Cytophaga hutchinsonii (strain ATCC 33406 / DSM 1761 / CIP 103989 / NBRC 15051 / NCIMB 9469 / D465) TaxID=269798 RepID=A0A6N4SSQ3_CYTH3|nr:beta-ketoacyl-[acyl-carrier-protein] synthase family protein [Cytophaga hutchinsonii]ABG59381.1 3-oxoacyl-[acyl-carrier-protein] synthase II [Cytophaga hutchinsonii ATCC 33406]SFX92683.1 3-oxoacyl-[acyl-carrier-protein] synthase-1 [Cytophaga hutchinsonii ATCC 33406]
MKNNVYILADSVVTPLGQSTEENMEKLYSLQSAIRTYTHPQIGTFYASKFEDGKSFQIKKDAAGKTKIERLFISCIEKALERTEIDVENANVLFVFASTKGNVEYLTDETFDKNRLRIGITAQDVTAYFNNPNTPIVVSNACISGLQAIQYGYEVLQDNRYTHVVVTGADCFSEFILSGFHSFQALSPFPCKPFDKARAGLSLGEGCGTLILSNKKTDAAAIEILSVVSSNDANHLSGPSRTGEGLSSAILGAINEAGITAEQIDVISAHGTATLYNDEMESMAFKTANLEAKAVYSVKGNIGHTLGAAGIIETIYLAQSLQNNMLVPSIGFTETGTSVELNVTRQSTLKTMQIGLKTASGFGGGNTALLLKK